MATTTTTTPSSVPTTTTAATTALPTITVDGLVKMGVPREQAELIVKANQATVAAAVAAVPKGKRDSAEVASLRLVHDKMRLVRMVASCVSSDQDCKVAYMSQTAVNKRASNYDELHKQADKLHVGKPQLDVMFDTVRKLAQF